MAQFIRGNSIQPKAEHFSATKTTGALSAYMKQWSQKTKERVRRGEPFIVADVLTPHEILEAMDIPWVLSVYLDWYYPELIGDKSDVQYRDLASAQGYDLPSACGRCGKTAAQLGRLPKFTAMVATEKECAGQQKVAEFWSRVYDVPRFVLESTASSPYFRRYPRWWERIEDHWDEMIEPHRLDYRVEELKSLIKFLEVTTGKTFSQTRLLDVMELVNQQEKYWRMTRDLIAKTIPAPIGVLDHLYIYAAQWHRGTTEGLDLAKVFYEEIRERVENGEALCADEKIRLQWVKTAYYTDPEFYRYFEDKYGAVFVTSWYLSIGADGYARKYQDDPLRALASRNLFLGLYAGPDWDLKEAALHKVKGAIMMSAHCASDGVARKMTKLAYEAAGIPMCLIDSSWTTEKVRSEVSNFIDTHFS